MQDKTELEGVVAPEIARRGLELVRLTVSGSPRQPALMVYVDRVGGVTVGECVDLARALRPVLVQHFGPGRSFSVGASSPGTDRLLRTRKDFALIVGRAVTLRIRTDDAAGATEIAGTVREAEDDGVVLALAGGEASQRIAYEKIAGAKMKLPF